MTNTMDYKLVYKKDQKLDALENEIAEIFSDAIYSFIIRKKLLKKPAADTNIKKEKIDKNNE